MAHHRRKKSKRIVRCTMCNPFSWLGNSKEKNKPKYRMNNKLLKDALMT